MAKDRNSHLRQQIAQMAARLMADEGILDYGHAKRKASRQLGISDDRCMPTNAEVEEEIRIFHEIYNSDVQPEVLKQLMQDALVVMRMLERFDPHLTGPVLDGTAGKHATTDIHLYAESLKEVEIYLLNLQIPYESNEKSYRMHGDKRGNGRRKIPVFTLEGPNGLIRLSVFDDEAHNTHVRSPVNGQSLQKANLASVTALLKSS